MRKEIILSDGTSLQYKRGKFDDWCVYAKQTNGTEFPPKDIDYFLQLENFSHKYGKDKVYADFINVYDRAGKEIQEDDCLCIKDIASTYMEDSIEAEYVFSVLYMAMIAEENKAFSKLGKIIKRLGVYQVLMENFSPSSAAIFSKGKKWKELDELMKEKGF